MKYVQFMLYDNIQVIISKFKNHQSIFLSFYNRSSITIFRY